MRAYACRKCHGLTLKHTSECRCGAWNTLRPLRSLDEEATPTPVAAKLAARPRSLRDVPPAEVADRLSTGLPDLDRVLHAQGGVQKGAAVLVSGDPGVGKSTLLLQGLSGIARACAGDVLYVTGEQSEQEIADLAARLGEMPPNLLVMAERDTETIKSMLVSVRPAAFVIDSLQRMRSAKVESKTGSVLQVRHACVTMVEIAKQIRAVAFLVAHITKDGDLAGPKDVEHDVDTVLFFERFNETTRKLHVAKNRFGSEAETATWTMGARGLAPIVVAA